MAFPHTVRPPINDNFKITHKKTTDYERLPPMRGCSYFWTNITVLKTPYQTSNEVVLNTF